jgi:hypothetical protein
MGILVPKTCWVNKTSCIVASGWFFTLHNFYNARSHEHQTLLYFTFHIIKVLTFSPHVMSPILKMLTQYHTGFSVHSNNKVYLQVIYQHYQHINLLMFGLFNKQNQHISWTCGSYTPACTIGVQNWMSAWFSQTNSMAITGYKSQPSPVWFISTISQFNACMYTEWINHQGDTKQFWRQRHEKVRQLHKTYLRHGFLDHGRSHTQI